MSLSDLEQQVMDLLLAGDDPTLALLRDQIPSSKITSREWTGVGFFTEFEVSNSVDAVPGMATRGYPGTSVLYETRRGLREVC